MNKKQETKKEKRGGGAGPFCSEFKITKRLKVNGNRGGTKMNKKQNYKKEEWGGWKIVSKMLDNSDECGIYPTSKCYQELYDFVCEQKNKARTETSPNTLEAIRHLKMEYANTQLDKRGNGYDWLKKLERKLNE